MWHKKKGKDLAATDVDERFTLTSVKSGDKIVITYYYYTKGTRGSYEGYEYYTWE